ncbi:MAG: hypothetical protein WCF30_06850 [Terracidiphilus sp.]
MTSRASTAGVGFYTTAIVAVFILGGLAGCGGKAPISPPSSPGTPANITGNWVLTVNPTAGGTAPIAVYLTSNAGSVSGLAVGPAATDLLMYPDGCVGSPIGMFSNVALSGTVSGSSLSNGSFAISGDCTTQGSMTGVEYPAVNGTYSGTVTSQATGQSFQVTATLDQSSTPNSAGLLALTGTATVSGYSCVPSSATAISASFVGNDFFVDLSDSSSGILGWGGSLSPDGKTLGINYGFSPASSSCNEDFGAGTLTLQ